MEYTIYHRKCFLQPLSENCIDEYVGWARIGHFNESRQDSGNLYKYVCITTSQRNAKSNNLTLLQY